MEKELPKLAEACEAIAHNIDELGQAGSQGRNAD
jgi:hypothetical protein